MAEETIEMFKEISQGILVDATFGGGGHTRRLLEALGDGVRFLAFDRDPDAARNLPPVEPADEAPSKSQPDDGLSWGRLKDGLSWGRVGLVQRSFGEIETVLDEEGIETIAGALFDLGVSSHQLDQPERGFSYKRSGPLDMRMGPDAPYSADELVNEWPEADLARVIHRYGEERFARRIAREIVQARPIVDTEHLADVVKTAVPASTRRTGGHPARRTFQALRIAVNDELGELERGLEGALSRLADNGRCVVISYHSLEDRIVKQRFAQGAQGCICPPDLPVCGCGRTAELRLVNRRAIRPSEEEVARNPRARSAILRAVEKVAA